MGYIVHVDNSEFFRKLMKTFLTELGFECNSLERGEDAVQAVNSGEASLVITGLELAGMHGEELIKQLVTASRQVPVIAVTSNGDAALAARLAALGARAVILKSGDWKGELRKHLK
ncbi:MAG: response regulator [Treponema sp.]|jgi:DNA-binding NtrC family response regulator|nr:response regulator [Treponema sp.]